MARVSKVPSAYRSRKLQKQQVRFSSSHHVLRRSEMLTQRLRVLHPLIQLQTQKASRRQATLAAGTWRQPTSASPSTVPARRCTDALIQPVKCSSPGAHSAPPAPKLPPVVADIPKTSMPSCLEGLLYSRSIPRLSDTTVCHHPELFSRNPSLPYRICDCEQRQAAAWGAPSAEFSGEPHLVAVPNRHDALSALISSAIQQALLTQAKTQLALT